MLADGGHQQHVVGWVWTRVALMPVVFLDEDDSDEREWESMSGIFLVCFELTVVLVAYYAMFFA